MTRKTSGYGLKSKMMSTLKKWGKLLIGSVLIAIILYDSRQFLSTFDFAATLRLLRTYSPGHLALFLLTGLFAIWLTFLYDYTSARRLKLPLSAPRLMKVAWIANTFNNVAGFGGLGGAGVRLLLYRNDGVKDSDIGKMSLLIIPATVTGLGVLMLTDLAGFGGISDMLGRHRWLLLLIIGFILYIPVYCWFTDIKFSKYKVHIAHHPDPQETLTRVMLTAVSALDWAMAALMLWVLSSFVHPGISYGASIGIFSMATAVGIASMIPGGIGSFDLMLLNGLQLHGASSEEALATLLLFRFFYYLVPLMVGGVLSISEFSHVLHKFGKGLVHFVFFPEVDSSSLSTKRNPGLILGDLAIKMLYVMVLLAGLLLVLSASTPGIPDRIQVLMKVLSLPALQLSHRLALLIGLFLMVISHELLSKIQRAWSSVLILLAAGAVFALLKGMDFEEALYLLGTFALLLISRPAFFRKSAPVSAKKTGSSLMWTVAGTMFYVISGQPFDFTFFNTHKGISLLHFTSNDFVLNGLGAFALAWILYGIWHKTLARPDFPPTPTSETELERVNAFLSEPVGNAHTHLIFTRDKRLFWADQSQVLIPYQVSGQYLVVLGEPIGKTEERQALLSALNEFESFADSFGYAPVYYQVTDRMMPVLHDFGYDFFKLGEEAHLELETFDVALPLYRDLRYARNRMTREGYAFEMLSSEDAVDAAMPDLRRISDQWLDKRREKRFSLGFFDPDYLKRSPVAVIRNQQGDMIAFASLMPAYRGTEEISVDLMRYTPECPNGLMDFLFLNLFQWSKQEGYKDFNLGMAPLFNVGSTRFSRNEEALAAVLYQHGSRLYAFEGLYQYKNKFKPQWRPRYLAYPTEANLPAVLVKTARLIN